MVKAMYAGVAGLKAHQSKMDVISNNIANVNTWGYKSMDTSFKESIYQTMTGGSSGSTAEGGMGGTNPSMVGYGAMVSTISSNFTKGTQVPTGQALDLFIDGTGFFAVGPMYGEGESTPPGSLNMSRVGDFRVINNYLVDGNGRYVYGFSMNKGGEFYKPEAIKEEIREENQPIPTSGKPKDIPPRTVNGITTSVRYVANTPNNGKMTIITTTVETKTASSWFDKIAPPTSAEDLQTLVDELNRVGVAGNVTTRYELSTDKNKNNVTIIKTSEVGKGNSVLPSVFQVAETDQDDATLLKAKAKEATNAAKPPTGDGTVYTVDDSTPPRVIATVTKLSRGDRNNNIPVGVPGTIVTSGATVTEIETAMAAANADTTTTGISYAWNADKTQVVRTKNVKDEDKIIPLPDAEVVKNDDGSTTTISYEDNKKNDGTATRIILTVTPADENAEHKGPAFDDGRMVFDSATGLYKMAEGVDTLKPLKLPTTCTYYDANGMLQEEKDIQLGSFSIEPDGKIYGTSAATGKTYLLGAVALISVSNPSGMTKADGPYYTPGGSSGAPKINEAGGSTGDLASEFLESANVDIATEFSSMITTQRGFQANSKIITVTDEMLQELVNMKR